MPSANDNGEGERKERGGESEAQRGARGGLGRTRWSGRRPKGQRRRSARWWRACLSVGVGGARALAAKGRGGGLGGRVDAQGSTPEEHARKMKKCFSCRWGRRGARRVRPTEGFVIHGPPRSSRSDLSPRDKGGFFAEPKTTGRPLLEGLKSFREPVEQFHACATLMFAKRCEPPRDLGGFLAEPVTTGVSPQPRAPPASTLVTLLGRRPDHRARSASARAPPTPTLTL